MKQFLNLFFLFGLCGLCNAQLSPELSAPEQWKLDRGVFHRKTDGKDRIVLDVKPSEKAGRHHR